MFHHHLTTLLFVSALATGAAVAAFLGWLLTEKRQPLLPFKPFNCRPCLTFHLTWLLMGATALLFAHTGTVNRANAGFILIIIALASFLNFFIAKQNRKIIP